MGRSRPRWTSTTEGTVVGYSSTATSNPNAFIFDGSGIRDLNGLVPAGTAARIAVAQQITGTGIILARGDLDHVDHALLLVPTAPDKLRITRVRPVSQDPVPTYGTFEAEIALDRAKRLVEIGQSCGDTDGLLFGGSQKLL